MILLMNKSITSYIQLMSHQLASIYPTKEEQQHVALLLLQKITGKSLISLLSECHVALTSEQEEQLARSLYEHCKEYKPLQYILGTVPFGDLEIIVEPPTLIPRPETEEWVLHLIDQLQGLHNKALTILDMCTGSGVIALSFAKQFPQATIYAVDNEARALKLAQKNAVHNDITNIQVIQSDLFSGLPKTVLFDLIVTNPPYISTTEYELVDPMVKQWEDTKALIAEDNGLAIIKKIIEKTPAWLKPNSELLHHGLANVYCEIGYTQGLAVKQVMQQYGYENVHILKDLAGHDRVAAGYYQP